MWGLLPTALTGGTGSCDRNPGDFVYGYQEAAHDEKSSFSLSVTTKQGCFLVATSQLPLAPRVPKSAKGMRFVNLRSTLNTHEEGTVKGVRDKIMADDIRGRDESTINYT